MSTIVHTNTVASSIWDNTKEERYIYDHLRSDREIEAQVAWKPLYDYIKSLNYYSFAFNSIGQLNQIINDIVVGNAKKVLISCNIRSYSINVVTECGYYCFTPFVLRNLLHYLRLFGAKIEVSKRNKESMDPFERFFFELAMNGKTDENIPELEFLKKPFAKIKTGRKYTLYTDQLIVEEPEDYNAAVTRFRGAEWFIEAQQPVTLIGCGGIGSNIAVSLCRVLGSNNLYLYDADCIDHSNLAGQNFGINNIGKKKNAVVMEQCLNFNPFLYIHTFDRFIESSNCDTDIVITGLDNMASRSLVYYKWNDSNRENDPGLLIDARLSAEKWQILAIDRTNKKALKEYESKWLFSDDEADSDICSYKQTAYAAQMIASFVTNIYVNYCSNQNKEKNNPLCRYVPFLTEYDASQMILRFKDV